MATIKDVAMMSGVSISTVSRALSGKVPVAEETRERVLEAVEKLNYKPNVLAQGLKKGETNLIALIVPNIMNPIFPAVARGVEDTARKLGYNVILCNTDEKREVEMQYINDLKESWVDGFIFATACNDSDHIIQLRDSGTPVVLLIRNIERRLEREFSSVMVNNVKGAYDMTQFLINSGNRRIAFIKGNMDLLLYRERYEGYCRALRDASIELDQELIFAQKDEDGTDIYNKVLLMLKKGIRPDAIFASSDPLAMSTVRALRDAGLSIPCDISVAGFDNLDISAVMEPPLTTMAQPLYKMGAISAKCLINQIENKKEANSNPKHYVMNPKLIIRKSTMKK